MSPRKAAAKKKSPQKAAQKSSAKKGSQEKRAMTAHPSSKPPTLKFDKLVALLDDYILKLEAIISQTDSELAETIKEELEETRALLNDLDCQSTMTVPFHPGKR